MNTKEVIISLCIPMLIGGLSSCNDFLDTMPDKRTDIDSPTKVRDLLVSGYPTLNPTMIFEFMSDNYVDNGDRYSGPTNLAIEAYHWEDAVESDWDSPQEVWDACYKAAAVANQALEAIEELGTPEECLGSKGEALLCRAYSHFMLANTFCMAYNPVTSGTDLGIPYITAPEKNVGITYERGTMEDVYKMINQDIEEGLPLIGRAQFSVPVYHFNKKAAYAFAARFNLFYGKDYDKVIKYATEAIGTNPLSVLRDLNGYDKFTTTKEWGYGYIDKDDVSNLLLITNRSLLDRSKNQRYAISKGVFDSQLAWSQFPGGQLTVYNTVFHNNYNNYFVPKLIEIFEITNQIAQTGQPHVVITAFTTDETLLCRAEAYVLKKDYASAATDLSYWYQKKGREVHSAQEISDFYAAGDKTTVCKPLQPKFALEEGMQTNMIQAVLHARRVEGIHEGVRWIDIKRYGIEVTHTVYHGEPMVLAPYDVRKAVQIPLTVLSAPGGLTPNPR